MNAGKLDRRIRIEESAETRDAYGQPVRRWSAVASVWAQVTELPEPEGALDMGEVSRKRIEVIARWMPINTKWRIEYEGRRYDIRGSQEIGRREGIRMQCTSVTEDEQG